MTRRPSAVFLGPHRHRIFWIEGMVGKKRKLMGRADRMGGSIEVSKVPSPEQQGSTLVHEILHMAFYDTPVHHFAGWNDDVEEAVISCIEGKILELFVRPENKPVVRWLKSLVH